jgi:A/G-specific adenine glycosylase
LTASLPEKKPRAATPQRSTVMLLLRSAGDVLLEKREARGLWGGLWSLPEVGHVREARAAAAKRYGVRVMASRALPGIDHGFTHFKLRIEVLLQDVERSRRAPRRSRSAVDQPRQVVWLPLADAVTAAIPTAVRKILLTI